MGIELKDISHGEDTEGKTFDHHCVLAIKTTDKNGGVTETKKQGYMIQGKDLIYLNAPQIFLDDFRVAPLGDGLYFFGGDLFCTYELLGTVVYDDKVIFDYGKYTVTVSWDNVDTDDDGSKRINPRWVRNY